MRSFVKFAFLTLSLCVIALCQVDYRKVDSRMLGTWKLNAAKSVFEDYPASKDVVMTVQRDGDLVVVRTNRPLPGVQSPGQNGTRTWHWSMSPDGATLTQTASGWEPKTDKPYRAMLVWDKQ